MSQYIGETFGERQTGPQRVIVEPAPANPYQVLGCFRSSSAAEIKAAYKRLAQRLHPDKASPENPSSPTANAQMQELKAAYEMLIDPERRAAYDKQLPDQVEIDPAAIPYGASVLTKQGKVMSTKSAPERVYRPLGGGRGKSE